MTQSKTHDPAAAPWRRLSLNTASSGTGTRAPRPGDPDDPTNDFASETSMKRSASQLVSSARSWRWPEEPATGRSDHREHLHEGDWLFCSRRRLALLLALLRYKYIRKNSATSRDGRI
jgi:hypothetical protein